MYITTSRLLTLFAPATIVSAILSRFSLSLVGSEAYRLNVHMCILWRLASKTVLTYLCSSLPVDHRPSTTSTPLPSHSVVGCSCHFGPVGPPAVSALLQCLASNCCKAGLSSSSPAGSRSGLGVWCWMLAS